MGHGGQADVWLNFFGRKIMKGECGEDSKMVARGRKQKATLL
jgi:hypothetical protein